MGMKLLCVKIDDVIERAKEELPRLKEGIRTAKIGSPMEDFLLKQALFCNRIISCKVRGARNTELLNRRMVMRPYLGDVENLELAKKENCRFWVEPNEGETDAIWPDCYEIQKEDLDGCVEDGKITHKIHVTDWR